MFEEQVQSVIDRVHALRDEVDDHWQIPLDEARVLHSLVRIARSVSVCEIGVSYGFSTLHLAAAAKANGGQVMAFEISERKVKAATDHLTQANLIDVVTIHRGDAREQLSLKNPVNPYDFVFIDAVKDQSFEYLECVSPKLAPRALLVTDNTNTHRDELQSFVDHLRAMEGAVSCDVPVGNGFELTLIERNG